MSMPEIGPLKRAWYRWKMLRLPWRKRFLVGLDLRGNTYWQFRDLRPEKDVPAHAVRWRRIVQYPRSTYLSDVAVSPQWHQWLRHQRESPPSLNEQAADLARQERLKTLAAEADARWEAKPSLMDMPGRGLTGQPVPALDTGKTQPQEQVAEERQGAKRLREETQSQTGVKDDPWKKAASGPSEDWQPTAWTPTSARKR
ncbi:hypothetical protein AB5N19_06037 [Seiridium cardinale]|uniref:NADH dehydrogenase [ubiquinone] 1 alpha subcomplex subunit 12 n=1 Tax=Seiridium cardinale TaxID=138064 RepID=A0ABR2Y6C7_9PEZI